MKWYQDTAVINRRLAYGIAVVAAAGVAHEAVGLAKLVMSRARDTVAAPAPRHEAREPVPAPLLADIPAAHLFGVATADVESAARPETAVVAPDTTLDVKLTGLLFSGDSLHPAAIIASSGQEKTYTVGEEVAGTGGGRVRRVLTDGVLLERQGTTEMLRLARYGAPESRAPAVAGNATGSRVARSAQLHRNDFLRLMRKTDGGRLIGFSVMPGPNREVFEVLGLQSNDVVTGIDGVALAERGGDSQLLERLAQGGSLTLTVLRAGASQEVHVDANRLPSGG